LLLRLDFSSERQRIKSYFPWLDLVLSASLTLIVTKSLDSQDPRTSREPPGRPHLLRMDSSLEPWQICKLPRRPLLPHTQMKLRIKRIYKECLMLLRTRAPMKSCSTKPSDDAAYQQYVQRILEATLKKGLIKFYPRGRNSREKAVCNPPDALVNYSCTCRSMPTRLPTSRSTFRK